MNQPANQEWSPEIAAVLSLVIPGLGQIYKAQKVWGICWMVVVFGAYFLFGYPGAILHLLCAFHAYHAIM